MRRTACRDPRQRHRNRRQRARISDEQMPLGVLARRIPAAGAQELDLVARLRASGPWAGEAAVAVDDTVDGQLVVLVVEGTDGERARGGPLLLGELGAHLLTVEGHAVARAGRREEQLHIVIGEGAYRKVP